jgi:hypothetical protein
MSKITELAGSTINGTDSITIELVEADSSRRSSSSDGRSRRPCAICGASPTPQPRLRVCSLRRRHHWPASRRSAGCDRSVEALLPDTVPASVYLEYAGRLRGRLNRLQPRR